MVAFAAFEMNTARSETRSYSPFELVFGTLAVGLVGVTLDYESLEKIVRPENFTETVQQWFHNAREIAL